MLTKVANGVRNFFDDDFGRTDSWQNGFRKLAICRNLSHISSGGPGSNSKDDFESLREPRGNTDSDSSCMIDNTLAKGIKEEDSQAENSHHYQETAVPDTKANKDASYKIFLKTMRVEEEKEELNMTEEVMKQRSSWLGNNTVIDNNYNFKVDT